MNHQSSSILLAKPIYAVNVLIYLQYNPAKTLLASFGLASALPSPPSHCILNATRVHNAAPSCRLLKLSMNHPRRTTCTRRTSLRPLGKVFHFASWYPLGSVKLSVLHPTEIRRSGKLRVLEWKRIHSEAPIYIA